MKPNLPVNRLSATQRPATAVSAQQGIAASSEKQGSGQLSPDDSGISLKVERHGRWALLSRAQTQLSGIQRSEQAIVASYRELLSLSRQLERSGSKSEALAGRVANLRKQLEQSNVLDNNLRLRESPARARYRLDRVDLLSRRSQSESLQIQLPNGRNVDIRLEADNSEEQNLRSLQRAFDKHQITASRTAEGQLAVLGTSDQLGSPWVFRGQGVRVPAGNPVPIQLSRQSTELEKLEQGLASGERELEKQRLKELLATLEQERRSLESQRHQLLQQIRQAQAATGISPGGSEQSEAIRDLLVNGDFTLQLNTLLAQANVSRFSVVALLGR